MAEDSDLERTEPASGRRLEQARTEGQVPQSRELSTTLVLISGTAALWMFGSPLATHLLSIVERGLTVDRRAAFDTEKLPHFFLSMLGDGLLALAPLFLVLMVAALAPPFLMGGFNFSSKSLIPSFSKLNPVSGLARMFSANSAAELFKAIMKIVLVGGVAFWVIKHEKDAAFSLISQPLEMALQSTMHILLFSSLSIVASLAFIAALDVPFQLWEYHRKLRMTKDEVRQEFKEMEGDPQVKGRIRSQQREMSRKRMMSAVPNAQIVVTNPTHYAVALQYDDKMAAPRVVAKGRGLIAAKIREIAKEHGVPLLEAPPLARALYTHTEIGATIPGALFRAVAEVMAYVYQLNHYAANGGHAPDAPSELSVPTELDPGVI